VTRGAAVLALASVLVAACAACGKKQDVPAQQESPDVKGLGQSTADITADTRTMGEASAAVNDVVRNAGDCDAARPLIPAATARLEDAARRIRTTTGKATLESLRSQLRRIADNCP
jgi:hypothetical protein